MTRAPAARPRAKDLDRGPDGSKPLDLAELREVYTQMTRPSAGWDAPPVEAVADRSQGFSSRGLLARPWDPLVDLDGRQRLLSSLHFAVSVVARYRAPGGVPMRQLDPQFRDFGMVISPFFVSGGMPGRQGFAGYHFTQEPGALSRLFHGAEPLLARAILEAMALNRARGLQTSAEAEELVTHILFGAIPFPAPPPEEYARPEVNHACPQWGLRCAAMVGHP